MAITLTSLDATNWRRALLLESGNENFIEPNYLAILETLFRTQDHTCVQGIFVHDIMIGFTAFYRDTETVDSTDMKRYYIHSFMIDQSYQGKGHGRQAFALLLTHLVRDRGATQIELSTRNPIAVRLYESFGFRALHDDRGHLFLQRFDEILFTWSPTP